MTFERCGGGVSRDFPFTFSREPFSADRVVILAHRPPPCVQYLATICGYCKQFFYEKSMSNGSYGMTYDDGKRRLNILSTHPSDAAKFSKSHFLSPCDYWRWKTKLRYPPQDGREQPPCHGHFGKLERDVFCVSGYLRSNLDQFLPQCGQ